MGHAVGDSAFKRVMRKAAETIFQSREISRPMLDSSATDLLSLLNHNNYEKGAWALHQLRGLMGDSAFFAGLRRYYQRYRDSTALSQDFAATMSEAAGRNLEWYFRQALTQPGYPVLQVGWKHKGKKLTVDITQTQAPEWGTYRIPGLELLIDGQTVKVDVNGRETRQTVEGIARKPKQVEVDPHGWWLLQVKKVSEN
jgi:aminopeptidase N